MLNRQWCFPADRYALSLVTRGTASNNHCHHTTSYAETRKEARDLVSTIVPPSWLLRPADTEPTMSRMSVDVSQYDSLLPSCAYLPSLKTTGRARSPSMYPSMADQGWLQGGD
jgi:hypothetical protein